MRVQLSVQSLLRSRLRAEPWFAGPYQGRRRANWSYEGLPLVPSNVLRNHLVTEVCTSVDEARCSTG